MDDSHGRSTKEEIGRNKAAAARDRLPEGTVNR